MNSLAYIIIPVHNRKNITLKCLETLKANGDLQRYNILIIDDGSTDGTDQAIRAQYPFAKILYGDGNLWWGGGIRKGMEYAYTKGAEYFIWLNDDCYPSQGAIDGLIQYCQSHAKAIVGAQCVDPDTLKPSYGGIHLCHYKIQSINAEFGTVIECDALNGNLVCLPRSVINTIGYPDSINFPHHYNDFVYTQKARKKGYSLFILHQVKVYCINDSLGTSWLELSPISLVNIWKSLYNNKSYYYWKISLKAYQSFFEFPGIFIYFYNRVFKLLLASLMIIIIPLQVRQYIKAKTKLL